MINNRLKIMKEYLKANIKHFLVQDFEDFSRDLGQKEVKNGQKRAKLGKN